MSSDISHAKINATIKMGTPFFIGRGNHGFCFSPMQSPDFRRLNYPKIGIYAGKGASHSWLWFVDMFEKMDFVDLVFLDEKSVRRNGFSELDVMIISGGDTFAVAEALGKKGAEHIHNFVQRGGIYMGSCAGAYLPMNSSKKPLDLFNFVDVKITNLTKILPEIPKKNYRFCTSYGCDFIFHPVREAIKLKTDNGFHSNGAVEFTAPLYGGPGMTHKYPQNILAYYSDFTEKTSFLVDREIAGNTLIGNAAVIRVPFEKGCFYLFGPHLEHPHYPEANEFVANAIMWDTSLPRGSKTSPNGFSNNIPDDLEIISGKAAKDLIRNIKRELSNSRIAASGLEFLPIRWLIGKKVYDPEKIRVFLESMWKRINRFEKMERLLAYPEMASQLVIHAQEITAQLRRIKNDADKDMETLGQATHLFERLQKLSITFFDMFFLSMKFDVTI